MLHHLATASTLTELAHALAERGLYTQADLDNALSASVFRDSEGMVRLLLEYGANPNSMPSRNLPPLFAAIEQQSANMVLLLVQQGADVNAQLGSGFTPLHFSVDIEGDSAWQSGRAPAAQLTELLLKLGADPSIPDVRGRRPIDLARSYGHASAIRLLERDGAT